MQDYILGTEKDLSAGEAELYFKTEKPEEIAPLRSLLEKEIHMSYPEASVTFSPPVTIFEKLFVTGEPDVVDRLQVADRTSAPQASDIKELEGRIAEATGQAPERTAFRSQLNLVVDRDRLLVYHVDYNEVVRVLRTAFRDNTVSTLRSYQQYLPIGMDGKEKSVNRVLAETLVEAENRQEGSRERMYVPLRELVRVVPDEDLKEITAGRNGEYIPISFYGVEDAPTLIGQVRETVDTDKRWDVSFGGSFFSNRKMMGELTVILNHIRIVDVLYPVCPVRKLSAAAYRTGGNTDRYCLRISGALGIGTYHEPDVGHRYHRIVRYRGEREITRKRAMSALATFLNLDKNTYIEIDLPSRLRYVDIPTDRALLLAKENNPTYLEQRQNVLEAEREVDRTKKESRFNASVNTSVGFNQVADNLGAAYRNLLQQDLVSLTVSIPLVDWGVRKGKYNMARNNLNVVKIAARQEEISLEEDVMMTVSDFNVQQDLIASASEALDLAELAYDQTRRRFIIGKADISSLTLSLNRQQEAQKNYIQALQNYWLNYYKIRKLTLHDFESGMSLSDRFDFDNNRY